MKYVLDNTELEELLDEYRIESRKELIGDDNSLKRARRTICRFIENKNRAELLCESKLDVDEKGFITIRDNIRLDEIIKNHDIKFYDIVRIFIERKPK